MKYNQYAIEALKDKLIELSMKSSTPKKYAANMFEAYEVIKQLQNNQRWYNPKDKLPESDGGVLAIVSGKPRPNITLVEAYCIAEYDVQDGWIVSDYPVDCERLSRMYISKNRSMDAATVLSERTGGIVDG